METRRSGALILGSRGLLPSLKKGDKSIKP